MLQITSDDYPCSVLGELVGPTHVLSNDKHVVKNGVGDPEWIMRASQGRDVAGGEIVVKGGGITERNLSGAVCSQGALASRLGGSGVGKRRSLTAPRSSCAVTRVEMFAPPLSPSASG